MNRGIPVSEEAYRSVCVMYLGRHKYLCSCEFGPGWVKGDHWIEADVHSESTRHVFWIMGGYVTQQPVAHNPHGCSMNTPIRGPPAIPLDDQAVQGVGEEVSPSGLLFFSWECRRSTLWLVATVMAVPLHDLHCLGVLVGTPETN